MIKRVDQLYNWAFKG